MRTIPPGPPPSSLFLPSDTSCNGSIFQSRKIIAWTLSRTLEAGPVAGTVQKAKEARGIKTGSPLVFHTDRGCQYVSEAFLEATEGMENSYSKKGYPWDNACIESFHALIKREWLGRFRISPSAAYNFLLSFR